MKLLKCLAILCTTGLVGVYGFVQSGIFNVAATNKDGPIITWLLHTTMEKSVERRAQNIEVPDINKNEMILAGLSDYVEMCAQCHGEPDKPSSILRQGLNPAPPDLEHLTEAGTAAEMFWIINNGIRMTGMPAFGKTHQANEIWPVVAFLQSARDLTSTDYNRIKEKAQDYGHHGPESDAHDDSNSGHDHGEDGNEHDPHAHSGASDDEQMADMPSKQETVEHNHGEGETHNIEHDEVAAQEENKIDNDSNENNHDHSH